MRVGKEDDGGKEGEKNRVQAHIHFFLSLKLSFCVPVPHVCSEVFIFFFFFSGSGTGMCYCIAECLFWLLEEVLTKEVEEQTYFCKQPA